MSPRTEPSAASSTFSGLRSRCTISSECRYRMPSTSSDAIRNATALAAPSAVLTTAPVLSANNPASRNLSAYVWRRRRARVRAHSTRNVACTGVVAHSSSFHVQMSLVRAVIIQEVPTTPKCTRAAHSHAPQCHAQLPARSTNYVPVIITHSRRLRGHHSCTMNTRFTPGERSLDSPRNRTMLG